MNKKKLKSQIEAVQFAMWELHLYLDTHPNDIGALDLYKKYEEKNDKLVCEFEKAFGVFYSDSNPGIQ